MTPPAGRLQEKLFAQRRAGLRPQDAVADEQHVTSLIIFKVDSNGMPGPARPLDAGERAMVLEGREVDLLLHGFEIARLEVYDARQAERRTGRNEVKALKLEAEARRASAAAAKWRNSSA